MRTRSLVGAALLGLATVPLLAVPVTAQEQTEDMTVRPSVTGELTRGGRVTFRVTTTHPAGFAAVQSVLIEADLRGATLEEIAYDAADGAISVGEAKAVIGTGDQVTGRFFRVSALDVQATTGGDELTVSIGADVLEAPPQGTRFRFTAEDNLGDEAVRSVQASVPEEEGGLSPVTVVLAVVAALLAGGFLGSRLTGNNRKAPPSVYGTVARRIQDERNARTRGGGD
jgi:hypothetical protein